MRKESFLFLIGLLVFVAPIVGVPESWKAPYLFVLGGCIIILSFSYRMDVRRRDRHSSDASFVEHDPTAPTEHMVHPE